MTDQPAQPATPETPPPAAPTEDNKDARMWGMLCHVSTLAGVIIPFGNLLGPFILWQIKKNEFPFVDDQGKEALNFQILVTLCMIVAIALCFVCIGLVIAPLLGIADIVLTVMACLKANAGVRYRYPVNWRLVK